LCLGCVAAAQTSDRFEVASIKTRTGDRVVGGTSTPDRFVRADATLRDLIRYGYDLQEFQVEGGPGWIRTNRYEVNARAAAPTRGPEGMRALVRRLLEERFALRTRTESREMPRYELVIARRDGKLGERLRRSTFDCEALMASGAVSADDRARCDLRFRPKMESDGGRPRIASMTLSLQGVRLLRLADLLQTSVERAVVDRTGLDGTFDLELEFAPSGRFRPAGLPGPPSPPSDGLPLETALQEQLGLKLESVHGPVTVLVVESAELPTPD
jgi:uncharacterized protein (TIGR03435 family)